MPAGLKFCRSATVKAAEMKAAMQGYSCESAASKASAGARQELEVFASAKCPLAPSTIALTQTLTPTLTPTPTPTLTLTLTLTRRAACFWMDDRAAAPRPELRPPHAGIATPTPTRNPNPDSDPNPNL